ncbi:SRPBCC domain-containing protein [Streptomyces sp. NPDC046831]|uniref:SRPBCC domain-containing protein n=1 Tax=Streptomyces sp. NPDC046831 TaxID=3154805 RepID=UPI0033EA50E0
MEHEVFVPVPAPPLREALADPARVARAVPGLQQDATAGEDGAEAGSGGGSVAGRLKLRVGGHTITYRGTLRLSRRDDGACTVEADAAESRGTGTAGLALTLRVHETDGGATVAFDGTATADGRVTALPADTVRTAVVRLLNRFAQNLAEGLGDTASAEPPPATAAEDGDAEEAAGTAAPAGARGAAESQGTEDFSPSRTGEFDAAPEADDAPAPMPDGGRAERAGQADDDAARPAGGSGGAEAGTAESPEGEQAGPSSAEREGVEAGPDERAAVRSPEGSEGAGAGAAEPAERDGTRGTGGPVEARPGGGEPADAEADRSRPGAGRSAEEPEGAGAGDADEEPGAGPAAAAERASVFDVEVPPPSLDPLADADDADDADAGSGDDAEDGGRGDGGGEAAGEPQRPVSEDFDDAAEPPAEAAHARRTMIGRSAEEVDHAPPRGRYAPVPAPLTVSTSPVLRWAAPAAAVVVVSAIVLGRVLRRHR